MGVASGGCSRTTDLSGGSNCPSAQLSDGFFGRGSPSSHRHVLSAESDVPVLTFVQLSRRPLLLLPLPPPLPGGTSPLHTGPVAPPPFRSHPTRTAGATVPERPRRPMSEWSWELLVTPLSCTAGATVPEQPRRPMSEWGWELLVKMFTINVKLVSGDDSLLIHTMFCRSVAPHSLTLSLLPSQTREGSQGPRLQRDQGH